MVGGAWTIVPSFLKAYYGMNEIITSLMMAYLGINFANYLIKGPFLTNVGFVPQTRVMPFKYLLPYIPGTRIHFGIVVALAALAVVYYMQTPRMGCVYGYWAPTPRPPCTPASTYAGTS